MLEALLMIAALATCVAVLAVEAHFMAKADHDRDVIAERAHWAAHAKLKSMGGKG